MIQVKIFDEESELDLEKGINNFLNETLSELIDIKYQVAFNFFGEEQIYCFSAMLIYKK